MLTVCNLYSHPNQAAKVCRKSVIGIVLLLVKVHWKQINDSRPGLVVVSVKVQ